jgi:hypothetical protein
MANSIDTTSTTKDVRILAREVYARYTAAYAAAKKAEDALDTAKKDVLALRELHGLDLIEGDVGTISVITTEPTTRIDPKKVRAFLTEDQVAEVSVVQKGSTQVRFKAKTVLEG